jgi:oligo-1,6-glucosidase
VLRALRVKSRDNARTPMQWDASPNAGFSTGTPWLPVNPNYPQINAAAQVADPGSVFAHYRRLVELRHIEPAVAYGVFTMLLPDSETVYAFTRRLGDVELLVAANFSAGTVRVELDDTGWETAELLVGDPPPAGHGLLSPLRPWEARVLRRTRPASDLPA